MECHWNFQIGLLILVSLAMLSCWLRERRGSYSQRQRNFNLVDSLISHLPLFKIGYYTHAHTQVPQTHTSSYVWQMFGECTSLPCFSLSFFSSLAFSLPMLCPLAFSLHFYGRSPKLAVQSYWQFGSDNFLFYGGLSCALWNV